MNLRDSDVSGNTPLHWAASFGSQEVIACLCGNYVKTLHSIANFCFPLPFFLMNISMILTNVEEMIFQRHELIDIGIASFCIQCEFFRLKSVFLVMWTISDKSSITRLAAVLFATYSCFIVIKYEQFNSNVVRIKQKSILSYLVFSNSLSLKPVIYFSEFSLAWLH